jgi:hypothetical protein
MTHEPCRNSSDVPQDATSLAGRLHDPRTVTMELVDSQGLPAWYR